MKSSENCIKVVKSESAITPCNDRFKVGYGIFSKVPIILKNEYVCSFSGMLVDCAEAKYMDPTYIFCWELGKGFKLIADDIDGDIGHFANSVHLNSPDVEQNAKFDKNALKKSKKKPFYQTRVTLEFCDSTKIVPK